MYSAVLSVLLMGMVPVFGGASAQRQELGFITISSPSPLHGAANRTPIPAPRGITASGMVVIDMTSGQQLTKRSARAERAVGSLAKLMTALIIVEHHALDEVVEIPRDIGSVEGTVAHLSPGEHFTVGELLSAMLIPSANDAAETLARFHSGTEEAFVRLMNQRAKSLGLAHTVFANPIGLDAARQWSTPEDIAWLAIFALKQKPIKERLAVAETKIRSREGTEIALKHTHTLLGKSSAVLAGKTGTTVAAKQCLMTLVEQNGRQYLVILLHSSDRFRDLRVILDALRTILS
jgi:D-alanyl-D-alanine carboxypeptidase (penicillin-binding protein 5/6)